MSHQRRRAEAPAAKPNLSHTNLRLITLVAQNALDQTRHGFPVDRFVFDLIDKNNHEREAVEFHDIEHRQKFLILRETLLVHSETDPFQLDTGVYSGKLPAALNAVVTVVQGIWRIVWSSITPQGVSPTLRRVGLLGGRCDVDRGLSGIHKDQLDLEGFTTRVRRSKARPGSHS